MKNRNQQQQQPELRGRNPLLRLLDALFRRGKRGGAQPPATHPRQQQQQQNFIDAWTPSLAADTLKDWREAAGHTWERLRETEGSATPAELAAGAALGALLLLVLTLFFGAKRAPPGPTSARKRKETKSSRSVLPAPSDAEELKFAKAQAAALILQVAWRRYRGAKGQLSFDVEPLKRAELAHIVEKVSEEIVAPSAAGDAAGTHKELLVEVEQDTVVLQGERSSGSPSEEAQDVATATSSKQLSPMSAEQKKNLGIALNLLAESSSMHDSPQSRELQGETFTVVFDSAIDITVARHVTPNLEEVAVVKKVGKASFAEQSGIAKGDVVVGVGSTVFGMQFEEVKEALASEDRPIQVHLLPSKTSRSLIGKLTSSWRSGSTPGRLRRKLSGFRNKLSSSNASEADRVALSH